MKLKYRILAIGAHPDDIEAGAGGLLTKAAKAGWITYGVDLARGELSNFGTSKQRLNESKTAAKLLGLKKRFNLKLKDGNILVNYQNRLKLIKIIRNLKPQVVLVPYWKDKHPDHKDASELSYRAIYASKYKKIKTRDNIWLVPLVLYYLINDDFKPTIIIDITDEFQNKVDCLKANRSQYFKGQKEIDPFFFEYFTAKARYFGEKITARYGEPYVSKSPLSLKQIRILASLINC